MEWLFTSKTKMEKKFGLSHKMSDILVTQMVICNSQVEIYIWKAENKAALEKFVCLIVSHWYA